MIRFLSTLTLLLFSSLSYAQISVFQDEMEGTFSWTASGDIAPNEWTQGLCAGSGPSANPLGVKALYITSDPNVLGCTPTNYDYVTNTALGFAEAIIYNTVPSTCARNLQIQFDSKLEVDGVDDKAEVVYSTDGGTTWIVLGVIPNNLGVWSVNNILFPNTMGASSFLVGFRFTYNDDALIGAFPLAIDNVKITGTDTVLPVVICPGIQTVQMDAVCQGIIPNFISLATATDNCTATNNLVFAQSPAPGTVISTSTAIQITVTDETGNEGICSFTVSAADSLKPIVICENQLILPITSTCEMIVPDVIALASATDNCTASNDIVFSQNPIAGTAVSGSTQVYVTATDLQGKSSTCSTVLIPNDTIPPTIICPADKIVTTIGVCDYTVLNYIPESVITENCPVYTIVQNPAPGIQILTGENTITMTISDQVNLTQTCTFKIKVIESQNPVITNCPANIGTCDSIVTFSTVSATDNCLFKIVKTDNSGLNSGDVFPIGITPMQYTAIDSSGNTAVCNFNVEVYDFPLAPQFVTDSISLCATNTTNIEAIPVGSGTAVWSVGIGTGTIANPNNAATTVSNLSTGLNTFIWTISSANCGSKKDSVKVYLYQLPSTVNITSNDTVYACSANQSLLSATLPAIGNGMWTTTGSANIINPLLNNTFANQLSPGWNQFYYTISNGICPSTTDSISIYKNYQAQILTSDTALCIESTSIVVVGNEPIFSLTPSWYFSIGQGNIDGSNDFTATVTKLTAGANQLVYRLSHPICGYSYDTLSIAVSNCTGDEFIFPTVITPNFDGKNDEFVITNLNLFYPNCQVTIVNRWGSVVFESTGYKELWDGTFKGEGLPMGTYFYHILLNDEENTKYSGPISIIR